MDGEQRSSVYNPNRSGLTVPVRLPVKLKRNYMMLLRTLTVRSFALLVGFMALNQLVEAQPLSPYSDFQQLSVGQMTTVQLKLTYVGSQKDVIHSTGLFVGGGPFSAAIFVPFRRPGISYDNDDVALHTAPVSAQEMKAIIDAVGTLPAVTAGLVAIPELISFALSNSSPSAKVFEAILDKNQAAAVFEKLRTALVANKKALQEVAGIACPLVILEPGNPVDVTSSVQIVLSGFRLNRATNRYVGTVSAKNNGLTPLNGPVTLVFEFPGAIRMFNLDGTTCGITPGGREFLNIVATGASFAPAATIQSNVELVNPNAEPIKAPTTVYAGPGAR